jgi:hypothetical protein
MRNDRRMKEKDFFSEPMTSRDSSRIVTRGKSVGKNCTIYMRRPKTIPTTADTTLTTSGAPFISAIVKSTELTTRSASHIAPMRRIPRTYVRMYFFVGSILFFRISENVARCVGIGNNEAMNIGILARHPRMSIQVICKKTPLYTYDLPARP